MTIYYKTTFAEQDITLRLDIAVNSYTPKTRDSWEESGHPAEVDWEFKSMQVRDDSTQDWHPLGESGQILFDLLNHDDIETQIIEELQEMRAK